MISIVELSGNEFQKIQTQTNNPNLAIDKYQTLYTYDQMKDLFNEHIKYDKYYMIVKDSTPIYTNLYDIYEMKDKTNIILDDVKLNIIFLPYNKKDVDEIKTFVPIFINLNNKFENKFNDDLLQDKLFVLMMVNHCGAYFYKYIHLSLKNDEQIILNAALALSHPRFSYLCYKSLQHIPKEFKDNNKFFELICSIEGNNIQYASNNLRNNKKLVDIALKSNPNSFRYISKKYRNDEYTILECIKILKMKEDSNNYLLSYISSDIIRDNKDIVIELVKMNGSQLEFASSRLKKDRDVVYAAIANDPYAYSFVDKSLNYDKYILLLILNYPKNNSDIDNYDDFLQNYPYNIIDETLNYKYRIMKQLVNIFAKKYTVKYY